MPWPLTPKVDVTDHEKIGKLFINVALGNTQLPANPADYRQWLQNNGLKLTYKNIKISIDDPDTIHLVIREKALIQATETDVNTNGQQYPLDPKIYALYDELFAGGTPTLDTKAIKEKLFWMRICDYCVSLCA